VELLSETHFCLIERHREKLELKLLLYKYEDYMQSTFENLLMITSDSIQI